ncbi:MAG: ATP-binding protein [Clostridia bacterium]
MKQFLELKAELMKLSLPIGLIIVTAYPDYNIIYANEKFKEMLGFNNEKQPLQNFYKSAWECIFKEDIDRLKKMAVKRNGDAKLYEISYRLSRRDGAVIWVNQCSQHLLDENGNEIVYAYYSDITAQKKTEQALRDSQSRYAAAVKSSNINIWEYDYAADEMTIFSTSPRANPKNGIIPHYLISVVEEGHIREDSAPLLFGMIEKLKNGAKEVKADLWIRQNREDAFWCESVTYTNEFDSEGKPIKAYCIGHDITKEKEAEKRYREEVLYREAMQKATMASININLTKNIIIDYKSIFPEIVRQMEKSKTAQNYFDQVYTELATPTMQQECAKVFNCDALLRRFASGETSVSMELTRMINKRRYWTIMTAHMMKKVETNEIIAFVYSTNVTNEKTMQNIMNAIVKTDYDFLVVVDALHNSAVRYSEKDLGNSYAYESKNFEEETRQYFRKYICQEDLARALEEFTLKNIINNLEAKGTYNILYAVPNENGEKRQKQLRFCYINRELKSFLMTRIDITAAVTEQEKKNSQLLVAVKMAEEANSAKSEFLSRISHEIRTPMNAIMGMDQLAAQHLEDQGFVRECIEKSQYASKYLLQLINDVLDMSKIESGKITLKNEIIVCQQFLDAISTIIQTQAEEKGVRYIVTQFEGCKHSYVGDGVRIQQILINILSNAVKFTPAGGLVHFDISQTSITDQVVNICFTISDTGIGVSKTFINEIFKPFAQEHSDVASGYGGSGLGLAISKNLAELMNGTITVESTLGEGTIFRVNLPLGLTENYPNLVVPTNTIKFAPQYDFSGKHILLVEDHQLNIMVAKKLLEFKNATVDVAVNGKIGFDMFVNAPENHYDAVLMDIRMPVMDGLESAKAIRNLGSEWAKIVPIVAMSANAYDEDIIKSKNSGMNAHLAKPIDAEILYQTLYQLLPKKEKSISKNILDKLKEYGADVEGAMGRFLSDLDLYKSCLTTVLSDELFQKLGKALASMEYKDAFEYAHTLKGTTGNMGLTPLYKAICNIVEDLRKNEYTNLQSYYNKVVEHLNTLKLIQQEYK